MRESKADTIRRLTLEGWRTSEIARHLGIGTSYVSQVRTKMGGAPAFARVSLAFPAFAEAATKRGISPGDLLRRIINVLKNEPSLIDAILDDAEAEE